MNTPSALPSFETQFNKITEAYIKGEIKPMSCNFCFCGTLDKQWGSFNSKTYSKQEFGRMERALFSGFPEVRYLRLQSADVIDEFGNVRTDDYGGLEAIPNYE